MSTFSQDSKWVEAKQAIGNLNWLEVISYYRSIGGRNVFVYSVIEGDKRLIVDVLSDGDVLLINKHNEPVTDSYENVMNSRKIFSYNENSEEHCNLPFCGSIYTIIIESHN